MIPSFFDRINEYNFDRRFLHGFGPTYNLCKKITMLHFLVTIHQKKNKALSYEPRI